MSATAFVTPERRGLAEVFLRQFAALERKDCDEVAWLQLKFSCTRPEAATLLHAVTNPPAPRPRMTRREQALCDIIASLQLHVEELGCTCATNEQRIKYHNNKRQRRTDSACTGVGIAVAAELRRRRALTLKETH